MTQFFTSDMFKNLVIVICLDLNKPQNLVESFNEWIRFIKTTIHKYLEEIDPDSR